MFLNSAECTYAQKSVGCCDTDKVFVDPMTGDELQWKLSDNGAGGKWTGGKDFIQFDIANDPECGGVATTAQTGEAVMKMHTDESHMMVLSMQGRAESKYETFTLVVDGKTIVEIQATDTATCEVSTCNMCEVQMEERKFYLEPGDHEIRIEVDTIDGHYQNNAYFRIEFAFEQKETCHSCTCPPPGDNSLQNYSFFS